MRIRKTKESNCYEKVFVVVTLVFGLVGCSDTDTMDIAVEFEQETGQTFDHVTYTNNPIENWLADMQSYVELLSTETALLQQNDDGMALLFAQIDK